jgi:peroxiredoxin
MNKKLILLSLGLILLSLIGFMIYQIQEKTQQKAQIQAKLKTLPNFRFYTLDSLAYTSQNISPNKAILLLRFNSECEHCQYQAEQIYKNVSKFNDYQILWISSERLAKIRAFGKKYGLTDYPFMHLLKTDNQYFYDTFGTSTTPAVFIYNANYQLVKQYSGEVKVETLLKYLSLSK